MVVYQWRPRRHQTTRHAPISYEETDWLRHSTGPENALPVLTSTTWRRQLYASAQHVSPYWQSNPTWMATTHDSDNKPGTGFENIQRKSYGRFLHNLTQKKRSVSILQTTEIVVFFLTNATIWFHPRQNRTQFKHCTKDKPTNHCSN